MLVSSRGSPLPWKPDFGFVREADSRILWQYSQREAGLQFVTRTSAIVSGRTFVFAGGGTGGHLFPAIAVAECLIDQHPEARIAFVGSNRPIEREILARTSFEHHTLPGLSNRAVQVARQGWRSYRAALRVLKHLRPAAVIGCGGGASVGPVIAARRLRIPVLLLEQNVIPGRATRLLSRFKTTVCLTYAESVPFFPKHARVEVTGNPVRRAIANLATERLMAGSHEERKSLLVLGGSQGALAVNDALLHFAQKHGDMLAGWRIVHQTGRRDEDRVREGYAALDIEARVEAFFTDMIRLYRESHLVISRGGGTTLSELACAGLPAILVPYPHAKDNHQVGNARVFESAGAAVMVDSSSDDWTDRFVSATIRALSDESFRRNQAQMMSRLARPRAAEEVAALIKREASSVLSSRNDRGSARV